MYFFNSTISLNDGRAPYASRSTFEWPINFTRDITRKGGPPTINDRNLSSIMAGKMAQNLSLQLTFFEMPVRFCNWKAIFKIY